MNLHRFKPSPATRRWLYGVGLTLTPLAVFYGIATREEATLWFALFSAGLNGLALANTPTPRDDADPA